MPYLHHYSTVSIFLVCCKSTEVIKLTNINVTVIEAIHTMYEVAPSQIKLGKNLITPLGKTKGLRQGYSMSTIHYILRLLPRKWEKEMQKYGNYYR